MDKSIQRRNHLPAPQDVVVTRELRDFYESDLEVLRDMVMMMTVPTCCEKLFVSGDRRARELVWRAIRNGELDHDIRRKTTRKGIKRDMKVVHYAEVKSWMRRTHPEMLKECFR